MDLISVLMLATALALGPTILYALLLWWLDRYEKEPLPLLLVAFVWGAVPAIIIALVLELVAGFSLKEIIVTDQTRELTEAGLIAPLVEEAVKAIILVVLFLAFKREFDDVLDGVIYGAMVGLGFALVENVLYLTTSAFEGGVPDMNRVLGLWVLRAGIFGLNHSMFTAFTGAALGYARSIKNRALLGLVPALGLVTAMTFHAIHNSLTTSLNVLSQDNANSGLVLGACIGIFVSDWGGLLLILVVAFVSSFREAKVIEQTLWEEVALGRLTSDEYSTLISGLRRWSVRWSVLFSSGFRRWRQIGKFFDLATELAFRKHRMNDGDIIQRNLSARDIARLRGEIDTLKMAMVYNR